MTILFPSAPPEVVNSDPTRESMVGGGGGEKHRIELAPRAQRCKGQKKKEEDVLSALRKPLVPLLLALQTQEKHYGKRKGW